MQNFMTYNDVSVQPGPRLNLILGPNGTGAPALPRLFGLCALDHNSSPPTPTARRPALKPRTRRA